MADDRRPGRIRWALLLALLLLSPCPRETAPPAPSVPPVAAVAAAAAPAPAAPVRLPESPWGALCEAGCEVRPTDPPRPPPVADPCPLGACRREVEVSFARSLQLEIGGRILEAPTRLSLWTGPHVLQAYDAWGQAFRCTVEVTPTTGAVRVSWTKAPALVVRTDAAAESTCELLREVGFRLGSLLTVDAAALDQGLADARRELSPERFADDGDLSTWLVRRGLLGRTMRVARASPDATAASGGAVAYLQIPTEDIDLVRGNQHFCSPYCKSSSAWTGPLRSTTTMEYFGEGARRLCERWSSIATRRFVFATSRGLATVFGRDEACDVQWTWSSTFERVPFTAPPTRDPSPPPDPSLPRSLDEDTAWPLPARAQPSAEPPEAFAADLELLGSTLAQLEPDPWLRLKAVHDWVATHIAYDVDSLDPARRAPQDAATVFRTRKGVCAGYANLMVALGRAAGLEVVYLTGHVRDWDGGLSATGHAWNAARIGESWVLLDATWDAGTVADGRFVPGYRARWLFAPPELFAVDHLPADPAWQLLAEPLSAETFVGRPRGDQDVVVVSPATDAPVLHGDDARVVLALEPGADASVSWRASGGALRPCARKADGGLARFLCRVSGEGPWALEVARADGSLVAQLTARDELP